MRSLREVRDSLLAREKKRIAVAAAEDRPVLEAVKEAVQMGIAEATLCGDEAKIRQIAEEIELDVNKVTIVNEPDIRKSAEAAVKLVHNGEAQLVMKGLIGTADFLRAVLNKEWGLRTGKILSHVAVFDSVKLDRLILMTDAAMVMYPTLEEKIAMINNTIPVCQALEIEDPKAAAVCAVEVLNPSMQPTLDAASLAIMSQRGQFKGITVDGPLALDNALNEDVKLRISLELYLKRLIVGGLERVYEIGRVFRNEGVDTRHNPEFTLMELYQAYTDYEGMMELTESMFRYLAEKVCGTTKITYNGIEIDLGKPFERLTMNDAIKKYAGIDFDTVADDAAAVEKNLLLAKSASKESKAWAIGDADVPETVDNNAKFYSEAAKQVAAKNGFCHLGIDDNGHLILDRTNNIKDELDFEVNEKGHLEVLIN